MRDIKYRIEPAKITEEDLICPACSSEVWIGFSTKMGKVLVCVNYPRCSYIKEHHDTIITEFDEDIF